MTDNEIIIIDDCIPKETQDNIEKMLGGSYFPWYLNESAVLGDAVNNISLIEPQISLKTIPGAYDRPQFTHSILTAEGQWSSAYPVIMSLLSVPPFTFSNILRIKANLTYPRTDNQTGLFGVPHSDIVDMKDYITAIYYVNDNDGDTYIFNEKYEQRTYKELTVKKVVSPKKGRMVLFKGNHLHSGNYPIQDKPRIVINFNFAHYKDK
jgi:hypothetical protein